MQEQDDIIPPSSLSAMATFFTDRRQHVNNVKLAQLQVNCECPEVRVHEFDRGEPLTDD